MKPSSQIPVWTLVAPAFAIAVLLAAMLGVAGSIFITVITVALAVSVFAAVMIILNGIIGLCLGAVVLLAKKLAPSLEQAVSRLGAPNAVVGVIIAGIVLLPEGLAAIRAARANRLQTSLNLALKSALVSIGLTIPAVSAVSFYMNSHLLLGISPKSTALLMLSLFVTALVLRTGRTIILHGVALLVIFVVYLFTTVVP